MRFSDWEKNSHLTTSWTLKNIRQTDVFTLKYATWLNPLKIPSLSKGLTTRNLSGQPKDSIFNDWPQGHIALCSFFMRLNWIRVPFTSWTKILIERNFFRNKPASPFYSRALKAFTWHFHRGWLPYPSGICDAGITAVGPWTWWKAKVGDNHLILSCKWTVHVRCISA